VRQGGRWGPIRQGVGTGPAEAGAGPAFRERGKRAPPRRGCRVQGGMGSADDISVTSGTVFPREGVPPGHRCAVCGVGVACEGAGHSVPCVVCLGLCVAAWLWPTPRVGVGGRDTPGGTPCPRVFDRTVMRMPHHVRV
jgi:hypothetical protein